MFSPIDLALTGKRVATLIVVSALAAGCAGGGAPSPTWTYASPGPQPSAIATPTAAPAATSAPPTERPAAFQRNPAPIVDGTAYVQHIDPTDFVAAVDHPFLTLTPGTKFVFDGSEHVEIIVLPETKLILGVPTTAVQDRVYIDGVLEEDTLDWYAQDRDGNVWYFGEQTAELDKNGKVTSTAGSWVGGVDGAQPGIVMLAVPQAGDSYRQEYHAGDAEDLGTITALTGSITVMGTAYSGADVIVTEEWTPLEPAIRERKTYVRGFGVVESRTIKGGDDLTSLTSVTKP